MKFHGQPGNLALRGDDLIDALVKEWDEPGQHPDPSQSGNPWFLLPNPLYRPNQPDQVVEHLLLSGHGRAHGEEGVWFTGRRGPLAVIVSWACAGQPGAFVLTGPAGSGKSAIAGRLVLMSNADQGQRSNGCRVDSRWTSIPG